MSYDTRKSKVGQEYVAEVEMILDCCRYTIGDYATKRNLQFKAAQPISSTDTGNFIVINVPASWDATWGVGITQYGLAASGEIFSLQAVSLSTVNITARGLFGTTAASLGNLKFKIMHKGEADGTCRGFPFDCSNVDSYSTTAKKSLIFSTGNNAGGLRRFPGLRRDTISHDAGEVDPGETIGTRAQLRFSISNGIHNDYGIVPYPDKQTSSGTMFGKLLARHPYLQNREVIFREGYRDANTYQAPEYIERRFIIDTANLSNNMFTVSALDPLILTEDKKAQIPVASPATLSIAITNATTTITYINAVAYYFGAAASTVYVRIDSEVIKCTVAGAATLTVVTRGYRSTQKDHDAGASVQDCVLFTGTHGINAILFAIQNYTKIPSSFIGSYAAVIALLPSFVLHETLISKPMAVVDFINSMVQLGNLVFGYDEETQKIAIEYTPELLIQPITIDQQVDIKRDSVTVDNNVKNQWTRLAYLFAPVDVTKDSEENFAIRFLSANLALESSEYLGQVNEKKTIKNGLLDKSSGDALLATSYVGRVLQNNQTTPKIITATLDASKVGNLGSAKLTRGSIVSLSTKYNEDKDGNAIAELYQVLKLSGDGYEGFKAKMRRYQSVQPSSVDFVISANAVNYNLSSFFAPAAGLYTIYINSEVEIGSFDALVPAFTTGTQAAGVSFKIINRGKILGMGGRGGAAGISTVSNQSGRVGGTAFNATVTVTIDNGSGLIWAGGGGADGLPYVSPQGPGIPIPRYGGGGGQGYGSSVGGTNTDGVNYTSTAPSGNQASPGGGGAYPLAGEWGAQGQQLTVRSDNSGIAIKSNGNSVTIVAGNNELNIKGRRT